MVTNGHEIARTEFVVIGRKTTICLLTLKNGFEIVGTTSCIDPTQFDVMVGRHKALSDARRNLFKLVALAKQDEWARGLLQSGSDDDLPF